MNTKQNNPLTSSFMPDIQSDILLDPPQVAKHVAAKLRQTLRKNNSYWRNQVTAKPLSHQSFSESEYGKILVSVESVSNKGRGWQYNIKIEVSGTEREDGMYGSMLSLRPDGFLYALLSTKFFDGDYYFKPQGGIIPIEPVSVHEWCITGSILVPPARKQLHNAWVVKDSPHMIVCHPDGEIEHDMLEKIAALWKPEYAMHFSYAHAPFETGIQMYVKFDELWGDRPSFLRDIYYGRNKLNKLDEPVPFFPDECRLEKYLLREECDLLGRNKKKRDKPKSRRKLTIFDNINYIIDCIGAAKLKPLFSELCIDSYPAGSFLFIMSGLDVKVLETIHSKRISATMLIRGSESMNLSDSNLMFSSLFGEDFSKNNKPLIEEFEKSSPTCAIFTSNQSEYDIIDLGSSR